MIDTDLAAIVDWTAGELRGGDPGTPVRGVSTDSRRVRGGELFVALPGERVDGHEFVEAAREAGAAAALVARELASALPQVRVADTQQALGAVAAGWRRRFELPVAAITGSNGKTTVKEMLAAIVTRRGNCLVSSGNFNNEIGLPLTLCELDPAHAFAVLELGAARGGDIAYLGSIARPGVGVITNIGPAHLEGFGDLAGVAAGKGELFATLPENGVAVVNADDAWAGYLAAQAGDRRVLYYGMDASADIRGRDDGQGRLEITTPRGAIGVALKLPGAHNRSNALAAAAAAVAMDMPLPDIAAGLEAAAPVQGRLQRLDSPSGWSLIDDSYNANPGSVGAAIELLAGQGGERWLVLGDMAELGDDSRALHARTGADACAAGIDRLYTVGGDSAAAAEAFGAGASHFDDIDALCRVLRDNIHPGVCCLVKGSRSAAMERVVAALGTAPAEIGSSN